MFIDTRTLYIIYEARRRELELQRKNIQTHKERLDAPGIRNFGKRLFSGKAFRKPRKPQKLSHQAETA